VDLNHFFPHGIAVIAVEVRTMTDATEAKEPVPISYVLEDAVRVVQFVRAAPLIRPFIHK
jgi:hypothetical protein